MNKEKFNLLHEDLRKEFEKVKKLFCEHNHIDESDLTFYDLCYLEAVAYEQKHAVKKLIKMPLEGVDY